MLSLPRVSWPVSQRGAGSMAPSSPARSSRSLGSMLEPGTGTAVMWHSGLMETILCRASARLWLCGLEESAALRGHAHVSLGVQPRRRISAVFRLGKQRAWRQRGRRKELPLPSASGPSPSCRLVYNFINSLSTRGPFGLRAALFLRDKGHSGKSVPLKPRELSGEIRGKRQRKANN